MAMEGLWSLACIGAVMASGPDAGFYPPAEESNGVIANALAVQTAMQQAREHLLRKDCHAAIEVLEAQLSRINGNPAYLNLLRQAYQGYIQELHLRGQEAAAREYLRRLRILDPGAGAPKVVHGLSASPRNVAPVPSPPPSAVRGKREDEDDPFQSGRGSKRTAEGLRAQAEKEFASSHFHEAALLFEQAYEADHSVPESSRPRWAYCKLDHVVTELNRHSLAYADLEREVRTALELAPRLQFGQELLAEIERRRSGSHPSEAPGQSGEPEVEVRDGGTSADGWSVLETTNFRIYYRQAHDMAEQAARVAEHTRSSMQRKWFGTTGPIWNPPCEIFLHATAEDYSQATQVPPTSPGHSSFRLDSGRVVGRRIDLHCDDLNLLVAVLPHEATHTVLAGNFGERPVPRWADEGMAVLTEPREKIDRHLRTLPQYYQDRQLFSLRQLIEMTEYPDAQYVGPFYAQSVSLVEFLSTLRGPQVFSRFLRDGLREGYETALRRHYGYASFEELQRQWLRHMLGHSEPGVAQQAR